MTTYHTGNPIGSTAVKDLYDNAENFDYAVNGTDPTWVDRLGKVRKSFAGFEGEADALIDGQTERFESFMDESQERFDDFIISSGYQPIGDYAAGLTITEYNQIIRRDGEFYRLSAQQDLPYTTTGDWGTEGESFVAVGDAALRQQLAGLDGGELVSFQQQGAGAQLRTAQDKMRDVISIRDFGAIGDGTSHPLSERFPSLSLAQVAYPFVTSLDQQIDWAAIQAALNYATTRPKTAIYAPCGSYYITDTLSASFTGLRSLAINGDGGEVTEFKFIGVDTGFSFSAQKGNWWLDAAQGTGLKFSGFTVSTNNNGTGTGISVYGGTIEGRPPRATVFYDVVFRGQTALQHAWGTAVDLLDTSRVAFIGCIFVLGGPGYYNYGVGVNIHSTDDTTDPASFSFTDCRANYGKRWIQCSSWCEGIYITNCSHVGGDMAIYWHAGAESGLHIMGGHFNNFTRNIDLSGIYHFEIIGALFATINDGNSAYIAINVNSGGGGTIVGNVFQGRFSGTSEEHGVRVNNSNPNAQYGLMIAGNTFSNLATLGVFLDANSRNVTVGDNSYANCGADVQNSGANNRVVKRRYAATFVRTLTGGSPTEVVDFAIPAGIFRQKPSVVSVTSSVGTYIGFYQYGAAESTATNIRANIVAVPSGNLPAGPVRFSVIAEE